MIEDFSKSIGSLALTKVGVEEQRYRDQFKRHLNLVDGKVHILEVTTNQGLEKFIKLSEDIYKDDPLWPGEKEEDILMYFDPQKNPYESYLEIVPFIAVRDGHCVGRICVIINEHYNQYWGENVGFFGFFECIDDQEVANELCNMVENVLQKHGKNKIYGPISPTIQDEVGILIDSFDLMPVKGLSYNPPYYSKLLEVNGYYKVKDLLHPAVTVNDLCEAMEKRMSKIYPFLEDPNIYARYFDWNNFDRDAEILRDLFYNQTFANHWGYYPAESEEWKKMLQSYRSQVCEELFLIVEDAGEAIAFALCFKDENQEMLAEKNGKEIMVNRQKWDLVGIKPDYHRNGLGTFIVYNLIPGLKANNTEMLCGSWVLEDNYNSLGLCKSVGMEFNTTYRVYQKEL